MPRSTDARRPAGGVVAFPGNAPPVPVVEPAEEVDVEGPAEEVDVDDLVAAVLSLADRLRNWDAIGGGFAASLIADAAGRLASAACNCDAMDNVAPRLVDALCELADAHREFGAKLRLAGRGQSK